MFTLKLVLKKKWYDLIEKGIKREEYREIKDFYTKRFYLNYDGAKVKKFNYVTFYLGYQKNRPSMTFRIKLIDVGIGRPEWGAEEGKLYYVIVLGERIMTHYYFYFNLAHYPIAFVTKVGENQQDQARLKMMLNLAQHEQPQRIMFEPMSDNYDKWKEYDPRVRQQERRVNFIDLWRFHFSPLHANCWEWLLCRSI